MVAKKKTRRRTRAEVDASFVDEPQEGQRWVNLQQLHAETGVPTRTLNEIRRTDPGVLVIRTNARGQLEYEQPTCAIRIREREVRIALARVQSTEKLDGLARKQAEGDARKAMASGLIEEMKEQTMRQQLVRADEMRAEVGNILGAITAVIDTFPSQYSHKVLNLAKVPEAIAALRVIADAFRAELRRLKLPKISDDDEARAA